MIILKREQSISLAAFTSLRGWNALQGKLETIQAAVQCALGE